MKHHISNSSSDGTENGLEMVLCGGCDKYSLLADAENAARDEERPIDEPHCPRCGTRVDYDGTTVRDFVPRSVNSGTDRDGGGVR